MSQAGKPRKERARKDYSGELMMDWGYYRCVNYNKPGHPRCRVREAYLDQQMLALFERMRVQDDAVRDWFRLVLASQTRDAQADSKAQRAELKRQETLTIQQQERLLEMRISEEVDQATYAKKSTQLRDRLASLKLQLDCVDRSRDELADLASKVFELSQGLKKKWVTADYDEKRRLLQIVCLNCTLNDVTLCPTIRKPFDMLAEGLLVSSSRDDKI